jgi:Zinc knuckle
MTSKESLKTTTTSSSALNSDAPAREKRYNRRGGRGGGRGNAQATQTPKPANLFKGGIAEMNGHTFQCYGETTEKNQYNRTLEELEVYVGAHIRHNGKDIRRMIRTMVDTTFAPPDDIDEENATSTEFAIWKADIKLFMEKREWYVENKCTLYSVIWSQCSEAMQAKIKSVPGYQVMNEDANSLSLLQEIKGIAYKFESQKNIYVAINLAKKSFFSTRQAQHETNAAFLTRYKDSIAVIEHYGGHIGDDIALIEEEEKKMTAVMLPVPLTTDQRISCITLAKNKSNAIYFLCCADPIRYATLTTDLENQFTRGNDQYPDNITDAYNLLVSYKKPSTGGNVKNRETNPTTSNNPGTEPTTTVPQTELAFVQTSPPLEEVKCYNCNTMGHYASSCTAPVRTRNESTTTAVQLLQHTDQDDSDSGESGQFCFHLNETPEISRSWILLDSESTVSIFNNSKLLKNIRHCGNEQGLRIYSNGGHQDTHLIGDLPGFGQVWYNTKSLANILSLAEVRKICRVTMDTSKAAEIVVYKHNGEKIKFVESGNGLYYYDTDMPKARNTSSEYSFVSSVVENKTKYTNRQVTDADLAKRVYAMVG